MATQTRVATQTSSLAKVVYVTRKVQADLFAIVDTYGQITQGFAEELIHDLRLLLDEEVIDRIEFLWTRRGTNVVLGAYIYKVISVGVGLVDDRSGGIRYDPTLQTSVFGVRFCYNSRWLLLSAADRAAIEQSCKLPWSSGGGLDFSRGSQAADRTYSKDGYGLARERFTES